MIKHVYFVSPDKANPLFQLHYLQGRVHVRDYAFYMRKLTFMQQQKLSSEVKDAKSLSNG